MNPGAPLPPAPAAPDRPAVPESIRIALQLMVVLIVAQLVVAVARFGVLRDEYLRVARESTAMRDESMQITPAIASAYLIGVTVVVVAVAVLLMWLTFRGYTWARIVLGLGAAYSAVQMVFALFGVLFGDGPGPLAGPTWSMLPEILGGVAAAGAMIALLHRDSVGYCSAMAKYRKARKVRR